MLMMPEKPQHRSKLIASSDRMTMFVINVTSIGAFGQNEGCRDERHNQRHELDYRQHAEGKLPAFPDRSSLRTASRRRDTHQINTRSALPRIDHVGFVDDIVAGLAGVAFADRDVHVHLAVHLGRAPSRRRRPGLLVDLA